MIENLTNNTFPKKIKNEICIDELILNNCLLSKNKKDEKNYNSNILIKSLQDFSKRCESSYGKLFYEKNYLISLNEIITLIQNSINAQQQLDNYIYNTNSENSESNINNIKSLNQKFINDLNYNIFSIEKINNNYYCFNKIKKKNYKNKKLSSSRLFVTPHNIKNRINSIFNNIEKEIFINGYEILNGNYTLKEISTYSESIKSAKERNKNEKTNNNNNLLKGKNQKQKNNESKLVKKRVLSNQNKKYKDKKNSSKSKSVINENNLSNELRNISTFTSREITNNQKNRNSLLKLSNTSKTTKYDKNMKTFDIFKICQNMKKDKQKKNKDSGPLIRSNSSNLISDINDFNDNFLKKSLKCLGFSQINEKKKLSTGIKKIIISNTCKPTNLANHLLIKGKKYINEFNKMDEESKKWK
jgi:hypothetical protein